MRYEGRGPYLTWPFHQQQIRTHFRWQMNSRGGPKDHDRAKVACRHIRISCLTITLEKFMSRYLSRINTKVHNNNQSSSMKQNQTH